MFNICLYSSRAIAYGWTPSVVPHPWRKKSIDSFTEPPIKYISAWHVTINSRGHRVSSSKMKRTNPCCHFMPAPIEGLSSILKMIDVGKPYHAYTETSQI